MAEVGYAAFSAREVARRIGYSVSTVLNVTGGNDNLVMQVNTRTFSKWADALERALEMDPKDRIRSLVNAYFDFAEGNRRLWMAIYDHKPEGMSIPDEQAETRGRLTGIVAREVGQSLPDMPDDQIGALSRSLIACVHGHCALHLSGSLALMGEADPRGQALARVRDSLLVARNEPLPS